MKTILLLVASFLAGIAVAVPSASVNSIALDPFERCIKVDYTLSGGPAVVTARFSLNGVPIDGTNVLSVVGDVQRLVSKSAGTFVWNASRDLPGKVIDANKLSVVLKAWAVDAPPDFMVVDVTAVRCVRYYETIADLPGGLGLGSDDLNRTRKIVMRRIAAAGVPWRSGSPTPESGHADNEVTHLVTLTNDYYIGVYPITQAQWAAMTNATAQSMCLTYDKLAFWSGAADSPLRPMETVPYNTIRGSTDSGINWPNTGTNVLSSSFLGAIRARTGVAFDLPTEAQWEYAARAGTSGALNDGTANLTNPDSTDDENAKKLGWIQANAVRVYGVKQTGPVGYYSPNPWDIYDIHGNVYELCRDWYVKDRTTLSNYSTEPSGPTTGSERSYRAGIYAYGVRHCRTAKRGGNVPKGRDGNYGFRLYAPCMAK